MSDAVAPSGQPWWGKLLAKSPEIAIAAWLVWWVTGNLDTAMTQVQTTQGVIQANQAGIREEIRLHNVDTSYLVMRLGQLIDVSRAQCVNASDTDTQRNRCMGLAAD